MATELKPLLQGLNALATLQHRRDGTWYPSQPWGIVKEVHLVPPFLAYARRLAVGAGVSYLIDLARTPLRDTTLSTLRCRYFHDNYFAAGAAPCGADRPLLLTLPQEAHRRARDLLASPAFRPGRKDLSKQTMAGPTRSAEVVAFLVVTGFGQNDLLNMSGVTAGFWHSPEFRACHALAMRSESPGLGARRAAANLAPAVTYFP